MSAFNFTCCFADCKSISIYILIKKNRNLGKVSNSNAHSKNTIILVMSEKAIHNQIIIFRKIYKKEKRLRMSEVCTSIIVKKEVNPILPH